MISKPKILVVCPDIPFPLVGGGNMRMASLIPAIALKAVVEVFFIYKGKEINDDTKEWFNSHAISYHAYKRKDRKLFAKLFQKIMMIVTMNNFVRFYDEQKEIDKLVKQINPDCIWLETPYLVRYFIKIKNRIPVIVDYWGLLSEGSYRDLMYASFSKKLSKLIFWLIASKTEKLYASQFKWNISVSTPVSNKLHSFAPHNTFITIPNGIVKAGNCDSEVYLNAVEQYDLIMTGDFSFTPNIDAAKFFVTTIWPIIKKTNPDVTLRLTGRNPVKEIRDFSKDKNIMVTGFVEDLLLEIARARIYIFPLRMGSGIRSKLFDVFPVGKPIVTTSTGAEGLELIDNENCFIADAPGLFAKRCIELLSKESLRTRLGKNVEKLAKETYAQQTIEKLIGRALERVLEGKNNE